MTAVRFAIFGPSQESANRPIFGSRTGRFQAVFDRPRTAPGSGLQSGPDRPSDVPTGGRPPSAAPLIASSIR